MIDFHCHIDLYQDPVKLVTEARRLGIHVLSVTTTPSAWQETCRLSQGSPTIRTALGLHPQLARERKRELALFDQLLSKTRYIGEVGLDGSQQCKDIWTDQLDVFRHILNSCQKSGGRILSVHSRNASQEVLDCLDEYKFAGTSILHWFSGNFFDLGRAIRQGCWFSVGPAMLRHAKGRALIARMPRDKILTESDGPFVQLDGQIIRPQEVMGSINELGQLWSISAAETQDILSNNLRRVWK